MITIVNLRDVEGRGIQVVDRSSVLGNDNRISKSCSRKKAIQKYKRWLWMKIQNRDKEVINELSRLKAIAQNGNLVLGCWCAPKPCHAEVIKSAIEWAIEKSSK